MSLRGRVGRLGMLAVVASLAAVSPAAARAATPHWIGTWGSSPQPDSKTTLNNQTVRNIVHVSAGGRRVSVRLTNAFGANPAPLGDAFADTYTLNVAKVSIGLATKGSAAISGSSQTLTF